MAVPLADIQQEVPYVYVKVTNPGNPPPSTMRLISITNENAVSQLRRFFQYYEDRETGHVWTNGAVTAALYHINTFLRHNSAVENLDMYLQIRVELANVSLVYRRLWMDNVIFRQLILDVDSPVHIAWNYYNTMLAAQIGHPVVTKNGQRATLLSFYLNHACYQLILFLEMVPDRTRRPLMIPGFAVSRWFDYFTFVPAQTVIDARNGTQTPAGMASFSEH